MKKIAFIVLCLLAALLPRPGIGATVTTTADSGPGSLRAAIAGALPGDTISFSVTGTINLTSGELSITNRLAITGPGPELLTVQRSGDASTPAFRLFQVGSATVSFSGLTLSNGRLGGVFDNGGAILNSGNLTLSNCVFQGNSTFGEYGRGAAIYNDFGARLGIDLCRFSGNEGTGLYADGGAIYVFGSATIEASSFSDNAVIDRGGGIHVDFFGDATINNSTFGGNQASGPFGQGGGLYNIGDTTITNCTFSGNSATNGGGAIYNDALSGSLAIASCTVSGNSAPDGGGLFNATDLPLGEGTIDLDNTIVAGNSGGADIENPGAVVSAGHNLIGATNGNAVAPKPGDQFGVTAAAISLGPLVDNGGPTLTRALLGGSLAIDAGDDANCPPTDQRGVTRPRGAHCDVGAFELNNAPPAITCPAPATLECNSPNGRTATLTVTVSDADGDALVVIWTVDGTPYQTNNVAVSGPSQSASVDFTAIFGSGNHDVTVSVSDGKAAPVLCSTMVSVSDLVPPTIACPGGVTAPTDRGQCSAVVNFPAPIASDNCSAPLVVCTPPSGSTFAMGATTVNCTATDAAGNKASCSFTVTVEDREAPAIHRVTAVPNRLWPPNHKLVPVKLRVSAGDNCSPVSCKIRSVTSNEPDGDKDHRHRSVASKAPDGEKDHAHELPDWVITGDLTLKLRAERSERGLGRVYRITVECRDAAGNVSTKSVNVAVAGK